VEVGEKDCDDILAQAAPIIRATARGVDDARLIEDDANALGNELAAGHLGQEHLTPMK
jgi:hypothetical protein